MKGESKDTDVEKGEKKHKKRQKKILTDLKQQIEFYFSEPNLQKDRFLRQKIMEHPQGCVEIAAIASFNRMKKLCTDINLVVKAMKMCPSVEVVDDCLVKPSKPLTTEPGNVDSVTVYVEKLPPNADHDWVTSMFSSCGKVVYVSLPRYKSTRDIKGFAFVEFELESEAKKALEMFNQEKKAVKKDVENDRKQDVEGPVEKQGKKNKKCKQKLSESGNEDGKGKKGKKGKQKKGAENIDSIADSSENSSTHKKRKRNIDNEASDELNETSIKVKKNGGIKKEVSESDSDSVSAGAKRKRENNDDDEIDSTTYKKAKNISESDDKDLPDDNDGDKKHKKRKRKKKEKKEIDIPNLKVISKIEWLRLKQEYQKLQRNAMTEMKMNLKKNQEELEDVLVKNENEQKPGFPKEGAKMETTTKEKSEEFVPAKLEMQPGVVLKYTTNEITEKQSLRDVFSSIAPVSYLENQEHDKMGFVRFQTREGCQKVVEAVKSGSLETIKVEELTEKEDSEYWKKLNKERRERLQQNKGRKKQRGSQKIAVKIEAQAKKKDHVHFDE